MAHGTTLGRRPVYSLLAIALTAVLGAAPARGQFSQYRPPGKLDASGTVDNAAAAAAARWKLGPLGIDPLLAIGGLTWVENAFSSPDEGEAVSDLRGTLRAGLNAYLPVGRKTLLTAFVLPSYDWWRERDELRNLTWNVGARAEFRFNRLNLELGGSEVTVERFLNSELEIPAEIQSTGGRFAFELALHGPWQISGSIERRRLRYAVRDPLLRSRRVESLDRRERVARLGVGYAVRRGFRVLVGAESSEAEFTDQQSPRSNTSFGPTLEIALTGNRLQTRLAATAHSLELASGAKIRFNSGRLQLSVEVTPRLNLTPYWNRTLVYSARDAGNIYTEQRLGLAVQLPRSDRLSFKAFLESGENRFRDVPSGEGLRIDDLQTYGGGFELRLSKRLTLNFVATEVDYRSPVPEFSRSYSRVSTEIELQGFSLLPD